MLKECSCDAKTEGGQVLLFYRYWENAPTLPNEHADKANDPQTLADFHKHLSEKLKLGGKFRIAKEGFNITLGGTTSAINTYIQTCLTHWSFSNLNLDTPSAINAFFKPTPGCACAFNTTASIRVTSEITPLGITNYSPATWSNVTSLSPAEFHQLCLDGSIPLIDVRNHYESRIGYFVTSKGDVAVRPAVRRFSQWPAWVTRHVLRSEMDAKPIATYCTGGIRCEKGARWMQEALAANGRVEAPVYTLHGGIVAYQAWMQNEVEAGRKKPEESFFKGRNYVFDGRGAISEKDDVLKPVAVCHGCAKPEDRLAECASPGCHLELVVCQDCEDKSVACCDDCRHMDPEPVQGRARKMCECESLREKSLWGDGGAKINKVGKTRSNHGSPSIIGP